MKFSRIVCLLITILGYNNLETADTVVKVNSIG